MELFRLACVFCDRRDCDGIGQIPAGWSSVCDSQSSEALLRKTGLIENPSGWWTHLGVCPDCLQIEMQGIKKVLASKPVS
jgi:hypothetical protein